MGALFCETADFPDDPKPSLPHPERVKLLETAVSIASTIHYSTLVTLHNIIKSPHGSLLVDEWVKGELVRNVLPRFKQLPVGEMTAVCLVMECGWVRRKWLIINC